MNGTRFRSGIRAKLMVDTNGQTHIAAFDQIFIIYVRFFLLN